MLKDLSDSAFGGDNQTVLAALTASTKNGHGPASYQFWYSKYANIRWAAAVCACGLVGERAQWTDDDGMTMLMLVQQSWAGMINCL